MSYLKTWKPWKMNFLTSCMDQALQVLLEAPIRKNDKLRGPELTLYDWCVLWEMVFYSIETSHTKNWLLWQDPKLKYNHTGELSNFTRDLLLVAHHCGEVETSQIFQKPRHSSSCPGWLTEPFYFNFRFIHKHMNNWSPTVCQTLVLVM